MDATNGNLNVNFDTLRMTIVILRMVKSMVRTPPPHPLSHPPYPIEKILFVKAPYVSILDKNVS